MSRNNSPVIAAIIVSTALVIIAALGGGIYIHNQSEQRKQQQAIAAQQAAQAAQAEQAQAAQATEIQQKKDAAKTALNNCISDVNTQVTQAINQGAAAGVDTASGDLQVQQTGINECQATYNATIAQLPNN